MNEIIFIVTESEDGGYLASALNHSIITDGDSMDALRANVKEAVNCHFEDGLPQIIRLHMVKEEVFSS